MDYQLREYKRVLRDFIPIHLAKAGKKPNCLLPWNWPIVVGAMFNVVVPIIFWLKKVRIGNCTFIFSDTGLSRTCRGHTSSRTWDEIKAVHLLSEAYLIELAAGGAMPVPYRVFTPEKRQLFEVFTRQARQSIG